MATHNNEIQREWSTNVGIARIERIDIFCKIVCVHDIIGWWLGNGEPKSNIKVSQIQAGHLTPNGSTG